MPEFPKSSDRTVIVGATGSGKTQFGVFLLATRDWDKRRWFILDFKGETLFASLNLPEYQLGQKFPEENGLYRVRVVPGSDALISQFFLQVYNTGNVGVFIDEGYMLPYQDKWVRAVLTQGRSKNIEIVCLVQRPVKIDTWFFSEASYICYFALRNKDDKKRVSEYMDGIEITRLPRYHCLWYDVVNDVGTVFEPVPEADELIEMFQDELEETQVPTETETLIPSGNSPQVIEDLEKRFIAL